MRLDKLLSGSGYGTRTEVKKLISSKKVTVDGVVITDSGFNVSENSDIAILGQKAQAKTNLYFILDKPDEVLTAMEDKRLPHVGEFIPQNLRGKKLSPVGRLDYHTTGLLIITNDGELSHRLTSPKYKIPKVYRVVYKGDKLSQKHVDEAAKGITLTDTDKEIKLSPADLRITEDNTCELTLYEGKTHEVRRIISHWGREVLELRRISIGPLKLRDDIKSGVLTEMTETEVSAIKESTNLTISRKNSPTSRSEHAACGLNASIIERVSRG